MFGAIEAGGTKFVCGVGTGPGNLKVDRFPTTTPAETVEMVAAFFRGQAGAGLAAIGVGSFGPVDLDPRSATFGFITATPKFGWRNFDLAGAIARATGMAVALDTDVNASALGEARWGAAHGVSDFLYLTIGTGIGGGAFANGDVIHGLAHPEMGHIRIPHDLAQDPYPGACPYHADCWEGLACGPAIAARWGVRDARELPADHPAWTLEAHYLALGVATLVCTLSPKRVVMGGGVMDQVHLFPVVRRNLSRLLNGYIAVSAITDEMESYVVPPLLGDRAGVLGALVLAERAVQKVDSRPHGRIESSSAKETR